MGEGAVFRVLTTRFNVRREQYPDPRALDECWLERRLALFESVTVPAIVSQEVHPHLWLLFFDALTPLAVRQHVERMSAAVPFMMPVYGEQFDAAVVIRALEPYVSSQAHWLVTTRLDNDDALHPRYLSQLYGQMQVGRIEFLNPLHGMVVAGGRLYRKQDPSSPFISLSEPLSGARTVWVDQHHRLGRHGPIRQIMLRDAWIQVVHGGNLANQVRGVRATPSSVESGVLPHALARQVMPLGFLGLAFDNTVGLARRYAGSAWRRGRRIWAERHVA